MFPLIEAFLEGNEGRAAFAQRHHISLPTFDYWGRRYHQNGFSSPSSPAFVEVQPSASAAAEIHFHDGTLVRFHKPVSVQALAALIGRR